MTKPLPTFRPDSLSARVVNFFAHNPDEELNLEDITEKFDATRGNIHTLLSKALEADLVVRDRDVDGAYVYRAGKALLVNAAHAVEAVAAADADAEKFSAIVVSGGTTPPAKKASAKGYNSPRKVVDLDALTVDEDVPFKPRRIAGTNKWQPLFDKLTKPGQSIAFPAGMRGAVGAAAMKINRLKTHGNFRVALTGNDTARIWRVA